MKALVAVDPEQRYRPALHLLRRLDFAEAEYCFASVSTPYVEYATTLVPATAAVVRTAIAQREAAEHAVADAIERAGMSGAERVVEEGTVALTLMRIAEERGCDVIVAGSTRARTSSPWHLGTVTRKLAFTARESILVTKSSSEKDGKVKAVFATDFSDYANACLDLLLQWRPRGIEQITVVTAYQVEASSEELLHAETRVDLDFARWVEKEATDLAEGTAQKLRATGAEVSTLVQRGEPNEVIERAMKVSGSDLLVLGAQGHGFLERLLVGSTSLHQVLAEPYPSLLLRLPGSRNY